jgi:hypothetical protein
MPNGSSRLKTNKAINPPRLSLAAASRLHSQPANNAE